MSGGNYIICVVFSLWTFIQTGFHLAFVIYAFYMKICEISPTQDTTIFFYLTYLYNKNCKVPKLQNEGPISFEAVENFFMKLVRNEHFQSSNTTMAEIVSELLDRLEYYPDEAAASSITSVFLLSFLILDVAWMVTSVALLLGVCFGVKQNLALFYYSPWLVLTACIAIFDALATIHFGLDMSQTQNFTDWLKFVGIQDSSDFEDIITANVSIFIPMAPSLAISSVTARFIIVWIINCIGFIYVMKATLSVYREKEIQRNIPHPSPVRSQMDLDVSAARIRNWQLFYGAIETTSTMSTSSSERDVNSNSREGKSVHVGFENEKVSESGRVPSISENMSTYYHAYPDVAESIDGADGVCMNELRSQLPWSYFPPTQEKGRKNGEEGIELENRNRRVYRLKSTNSSVSGTEI